MLINPALTPVPRTRTGLGPTRPAPDRGDTAAWGRLGSAPSPEPSRGPPTWSAASGQPRRPSEELPTGAADGCPGAACVAPLPSTRSRAGWPCGLVTANVLAGWPGHRAEPRTRKGGLCSGKPTDREESTPGTALRLDSRGRCLFCAPHSSVSTSTMTAAYLDDQGEVTFIEKYV